MQVNAKIRNADVVGMGILIVLLCHLLCSVVLPIGCRYVSLVGIILYYELCVKLICHEGTKAQRNQDRG